MILRRGRNCGGIDPAQRVAALIDAASYFEVLHDVLLTARHQIAIAGWDFDSRLRLRRDQPLELNESLLDVLASVARRRPQLEVYILTWDYAMLYTFERETGQARRVRRWASEGVHHHLDDNHPLGGSQHEKLVVVDDDIAFCGGLDLCDVRWDTPAHDPADPRRIDLQHHPYPPHHDVQLMVQGPVAHRLGRAFRRRWEDATGERIAEIPRAALPWPRRVDVWARDVEVAQARTVVADEHDDRGAVDEVETLWLDSLDHAEDWIYIETPYFTSTAITKTLAEVLARPEGPQVLLVTADRESGWFERNTMSVLRDRRLRELEAADVHDRLRVVSPVVPKPDGSLEDVHVHSKLAVIDGRFVRIGSSNLTDRSMGLDRELDLAMEGDAAEPMAWRLVGALLGEHLGCDRSAVVDTIRARGLLATLDELGNGERTVRPYTTKTSPVVDRVIPGGEIIDPGEPVAPKDVPQLLLQPTPSHETRWRWWSIGWWTAALLTIAIINAFDWVTYDDLAVFMARFGDPGLASLLAVAAIFTVAGALLVPVTLMIINAGFLFGPGLGTVYAFVGAFTSAAIYWLVGRRVSKRLVDPLAGPRVRSIMRSIARRGIVAVAAIRLLPIAPHVVIGLLAGGSRISFRDYMLGSILGMGPGIVLLVWFGDSVAGIERISDVWRLWPVVLAGLASLALAWGLNRLVHRQRQDA